jgi:hypothetical protein
VLGQVRLVTTDYDCDLMVTFMQGGCVLALAGSRQARQQLYQRGGGSGQHGLEESKVHVVVVSRGGVGAGGAVGKPPVWWEDPVTCPCTLQQQHLFFYCLRVRDRTAVWTGGTVM